MKNILLTLTAAVAVLVFMCVAAEQGVHGPSRAAENAKAARVAFKVRCVDLRYSHAKLSDADLKDLQTCKAMEDEDWAQVLRNVNQDNAQETARAVQHVLYVCRQLRDAKIADMTPSNLAMLNACGASGY